MLQRKDKLLQLASGFYISVWIKTSLKFKFFFSFVILRKYYTSKGNTVYLWQSCNTPDDPLEYNEQFAENYG